MANCPNCGSEHIQLKKDTNVDWGRAVAGWALFGVVGGAVGAVTGEDRNANACLDCGTSWKAADLYKTRQVIKNLTGVTVDLSHEKDRNFINDFISQVSPYIEAISDVQKNSQKRIKEIREQDGVKSAAGCGAGCLTAIGGCTAVASFTSSDAIFLVLLLPPLLGWFIGWTMDLISKQTLEQRVQEAKKEAEKVTIIAEKNLRREVANFMARHPL